MPRYQIDTRLSSVYTLFQRREVTVIRFVEEM